MLLKKFMILVIREVKGFQILLHMRLIKFFKAFASKPVKKESLMLRTLLIIKISITSDISVAFSKKTLNQCLFGSKVFCVSEDIYLEITTLKKVKTNFY